MRGVCFTYQRWPTETKENNEIGSNTNLFLTNFIKKEPTMVLLNQTLGRNMGVEPTRHRFTAGCVNRFTNCASAIIIYALNNLFKSFLVYLTSISIYLEINQKLIL